MKANKKKDTILKMLKENSNRYISGEELSEMLVQKQHGYNDKPIVILNTNGFYDDLIKFFDKIV